VSFTVLDVGCRGGPPDAWLPIPDLRIIGFDVDGRECKRLISLYPQFTFVTCALGSKAGEGCFYLAQDTSSSSFYPPREEVLSSYKVVDAWDKVPIRTLDSFAQEYFPTGADFLKLDAQGYELEILWGSVETLKSVVLVQAEVEFNPLYQGQPLFGEVDAFLRAQGFELWDFRQITHYGRGQLYWADAYYVPKPLRDFDKTQVIMHALEFNKFFEAA